MNPIDQPSPADVVRFYMEAGVDAPLQDKPVNRLAEQIVKPETPLRSIAPKIAQFQLPDVDPSKAQSLDELKAMIEAFEGCALSKNATQMVFSDGLPGSKVMIIGDAPSRDDDTLGLPFAGKTGHLLDLILKAVGLDRTSVYLANSIYWRTPGNRTPTVEESAQCLPFIRRQIALAKPEFIVLAGAVSARTLLVTQAGILQLRGNWAEIELPQLGTIAALPTLAPDYLIRNPAHKRLAWADWQSLKVKLKNA